MATMRKLARFLTVLSADDQPGYDPEENSAITSRVALAA
jgi:hypothetical protein